LNWNSQPASITVTVTPYDGFNSDVALQVIGSPSALNCVSVSPTVIKGGSGKATVVITPAIDCIGDQSFAIDATSGALAVQQNVKLTITGNGLPDFSLESNPSGLTEYTGHQADTVQIFASGINGYTSGADCTASGAGNGLVTEFINGNHIDLSSGYGSATLSVAPGNATPGSSVITVTCTSSPDAPVSVTHSTQLHVTVY
jgi:hypothetical protein